MSQVVNKQVQLSLVGLDGNAAVLIGAFRRQARREGWNDEEIEKVQTEAMSDDYDHLLQTLMAHCISAAPKRRYCDWCGTEMVEEPAWRTVCDECEGAEEDYDGEG